MYKADLQEPSVRSRLKTLARASPILQGPELGRMFEDAVYTFLKEGSKMEQFLDRIEKMGRVFDSPDPTAIVTSEEDAEIMRETLKRQLEVYDTAKTCRRRAMVQFRKTHTMLTQMIGSE
jgi:hypothetical protein